MFKEIITTPHTNPVNMLDFIRFHLHKQHPVNVSYKNKVHAIKYIILQEKHDEDFNESITLHPREGRKR